jgi:hypothetical protein
MWWWAEHGAAGLNFHTGDRVAAGNALHPSKYTAFFSTTNGYDIRPLGYGITAFKFGSHGRLVPAKMTNPDGLNLSAYAVMGDGQAIYLTVINKEHGDGAREAKVSFPKSSTGEVLFLSEPDENVAATTGETLGHAEIQRDGSWNGKWETIDSSEINIPPASAAILKLKD